ncbi:hypothetical protein HPB52_006437 [Rhipicephalus sanguineus]|uniref:Tick transposon n=1 Tax=Rhipicephalus sanguineus TaxID=34632 RepID=A0A9D4Q5V1_RHISA|nr:hypothetical protein HPB52_006437 [Rhipicephalus sanguineus]
MFRTVHISSSKSFPAVAEASLFVLNVYSLTKAASASLLLVLCKALSCAGRNALAQKHNRSLLLRLARLASDMEEHCSSLLRQQWGQICDRMAGNLGPPRHVVASQGATRLHTHQSFPRKDISHLLHSSPLTHTEFLAALRDRNLSIGLSCSPTKSGLLLLLPRGMAPLSPYPLIFSVDGRPLPLVSTLRILRPFLESNGKHTTLITQLSNTVHQNKRLIRRIANRHHDMGEHDLRRLEDKVNSLTHQASKSPMFIPTSTSTTRLLSMGLHNSITELTEAHRTAQLPHRSRTRPGRALISTLKLAPLPTSLPIPFHVSSLLAIDPLPQEHASRAPSLP